MTESEKATYLMKLCEMARSDSNARHSTEWRLLFGLWGLVMAITYAFMTLKGFYLPPATTGFWLVVLIYSMLFLTTMYSLVLPLCHSNAVSDAFVTFYRNEVHKCIYGTYPPAANRLPLENNPFPEIQGIGNDLGWTLGFKQLRVKGRRLVVGQVVVTITLMAASIAAIAFKP